MRALGTLLILCIALAVVKMVVAGLLMIGIMITVWAACQYPRETFGLLTYCAVMGVASAHPVFAIMLVIAAVIGGYVGKDTH